MIEPDTPRHERLDKPSPLRGAMLGGVALAEPTQPMGLSTNGEMGRRIVEARVGDNIAYLSDIDHLRYVDGTTETHSWEELLSGEVKTVSGHVVSPNSKKCIKLARAELEKSVQTFGGVVKTGVDYRALARNHPTERYKFYHSFAEVESSEEYLTEVIKRAAEMKISMAMKSFDHAYDGINIYTFHFSQMAEIIRSVYVKYPQAWGDTEHFLQGKLHGVDEHHVGWAQEPIVGLGHLSHSGRMRIIGSELNRSGMNRDAYLVGCQMAGVRADKPWMLTPEYEKRLAIKAST